MLICVLSGGPLYNPKVLIEYFQISLKSLSKFLKFHEEIFLCRQECLFVLQLKMSGRERTRECEEIEIRPQNK